LISETLYDQVDFSPRIKVLFSVGFFLFFKILKDAAKREIEHFVQRFRRARDITDFAKRCFADEPLSFLENTENNGISFFPKFSNISSVYCNGNKNGVHVDLAWNEICDSRSRIVRGRATSAVRRLLQRTAVAALFRVFVLSLFPKWLPQCCRAFRQIHRRRLCHHLYICGKTTFSVGFLAIIKPRDEIALRPCCVIAKALKKFRFYVFRVHEQLRACRAYCALHCLT